MQYLREAAQAVQRNLTSFLLYAAFIGGFGVVTILIVAPFVPEKDEPVSFALRLLDVGMLLVAVHVSALAQTVIFSRIGREIDRPLWRVHTDAEALTRFFMMWALINLAGYGLYRLAEIDYGSGEATSINYALFLVAMSVWLVSIPFGACMMFTGQVSTGTIGEALAPLTRQPGRSLLVFAVISFQIMLFHISRSLLLADEGAAPLLLARIGVGLTSDIVQTYLDCLAFAATWQLCMVDRDTIDEIDLDF